MLRTFLQRELSACGESKGGAVHSF